MANHEKVFGVCENKCFVEVYSKEDTYSKDDTYSKEEVDALASNVTTKDFTFKIPSLAANSCLGATVTITKTGYTPVGIIQVTAGNFSGLCSITEFKIDYDTTATISLFNHSSGALSNVTGRFTVLYKKN